MTRESMAVLCRVELLGQLKIRVGDTETTMFRTYKTGALLAWLAYSIGRPVPREELIESLWPDSSSSQARNSLSQSLSSLRNHLEPPGTEVGSVLEAGRHTVRILESGCKTDVLEFRSLCKGASQAELRGEGADWERPLRQACGLFKGEFLPGYYEDWTLAPREHLREEVLGILDRLCALELERKKLREALALSLQASVIDPLREKSYQTSIYIYDQLGQHEAALKQYRDCERALISGLGVKPSDQTRTLAKTALAHRRSSHSEPENLRTKTVAFSGTPSWVMAMTVARPTQAPTEPGIWRHTSPTAALEFAKQLLASDSEARVSVTTSHQPASLSAKNASPGQIIGDQATAALMPDEWTDLGAYDLVEGSTRVFATKATAGPIAVEGQKPRPFVTLNKFFGRETELAGVTNILETSKCRLVTLTGPGGMGKTRLSQEVANRLTAAFPGGICFVPLEDITSGQQIWQAIASALKMESSPNTSLPDLLVARLSCGRWLLVLDNFEQLCDVGGPEMVQDLMGRVPGLHILVSSRRRLGLPGEIESPLAPLTTIDEASGTTSPQTSPAVALFLDRAQAARPDFHLTEENRADVFSLCDRLEGIPLALELAASRSHVLTPGQILSRFDQRLDILANKRRADRHRSLRSAIDWSYHMLSDDLKKAFRQLAVFKGSWDEEAAEGVLGSVVTLDLLADLQEYSLITSFEDSKVGIRFRMLDTLREFARQTSSTAEWDDSLERHAQQVLQTCEFAEPLMEGPEQIAVLDKMELDRFNIATALETFVSRSMADEALRLCGCCWRFWHMKSHLDEGRKSCELALSLKGGSSQSRARALNGLGRLSYLQGDYAFAKMNHEAAMVSGDVSDETRALALNGLGAVAYETGDYPKAVRLFSECLQIRRTIRDDFGIGNTLSWLGIVYTDQCCYDDARRVLEDSLEIRKRLGDVSGVARALNSLGIVARRLMQDELARDYYQQALDIQRKLGDRRAISGLLSNLAMVSMSLEHFDEAESLLLEASAINEDIGDKWGIATVKANQASLALGKRDIEQSMRLNMQALKLRFELRNQWGIAYSLEGIARTLIASQDFERAALAIGHAQELRNRIGSPMPPSEQEQLKDSLKAIENVLQSPNLVQLLAHGAETAVEILIEQLDSVTKAKH